MKSTYSDSKENSGALPDDLQLIPAGTVREQLHLSEPTLWRADRDGSLPRVRLGRRCYYRLSDLRAYVNRGLKAPPITVPRGNKLEAPPARK